jgi:hypothetical protein
MLVAQLLGTGPHWRPLAEALELLAGRCKRRLHPLPWALPVPLRVHGRTGREEVRAEVLAAFDAVDERGAPRSHREGVLWHQPTATDLLFVTLKKSEALFSPTTRTRDLALGPSLFHWESQSTTTAASATGQRYVHHAARGSRVLLFVREQRRQGGRAAGVAGSPSRSCAWGLPGTRATRASGRWRFAGGWSGRFRWGGCR